MLVAATDMNRVKFMRVHMLAHRSFADTQPGGGFAERKEVGHCGFSCRTANNQYDSGQTLFSARRGPVMSRLCLDDGERLAALERHQGEGADEHRQR
jgi:hypothetical protein